MSVQFDDLRHSLMCLSSFLGRHTDFKRGAVAPFGVRAYNFELSHSHEFSPSYEGRPLD
jgi:hypothetical protein